MELSALIAILTLGDQYLFNILYKWLKEFDEKIHVIVPWGDKEQIDWPDGIIVGGAGKACFHVM